jgi:hypothetical protein
MYITHRIVDNHVVTYKKILVHIARISSYASFNGNINNPQIKYEAMKAWLQTEPGKWVGERVHHDDIEVVSFIDPLTMDTVFKVAANLKDSDATFFLLKYDIR